MGMMNEKLGLYLYNHKELVALYDATKELNDAQCLDFVLSERKEIDGGAVQLLNVKLPSAYVGFKCDGDIPFLIVQNGRSGMSFTIRADQINDYSICRKKDDLYKEMNYSVDLKSVFGVEFKMRFTTSLPNKDTNR